MVLSILEIIVDFVLIILLALVVFYIVSIFNTIVSLRNSANKAWANIDVLLKQRSDLIPNLVSVVKGYADYEQKTLIELTKLRAQLMRNDALSAKAKASEGISFALKSIFITAERYPELKADKHFMELQNQLTSLENQIADRREFYNNSVMLFNTRIKSFPDTLLVAILGYVEKEYFKRT